MPDASTNIATQGGAVTGNVTTGGDFAGRDLYKQIHYHTGPTPAGFLYVGVPSLPHHFLGRDELVAELVKRLCAGQTTALAADGLPGVGKTTLAVALARHPQILAHFRDGILWAGLGRLADVASIQATWGDALGVDLRDLPHPYARTQRLTNAIGHRRLLLVLDDVWQWEAADQLRCSAPGVATLLTTRDQALARRFAGAHQCVNVPVLEAQPAYDLLAALAPEACATDPAAAQRLAALVDGLPLALELLGGYLDANRRTQARRQQALTVLTDPATRLALATQRLGDPHHQAVTLQATIALSLADLPAATVAAFHALGAFAPKPARFTLPAALAVTGADEETLFTLADRNLVEMGTDEMLALHQTLSALARTQLPAEVTTRHRDYYLSLVNEDREDWQRIETIYEQVSFAWKQLQTNDSNAIRFVNSLFTFQPRRGLWQDRHQWLVLALNAAQYAQDQKAEAHILHEYGYLYELQGQRWKALTYYEQALTLHHQVKGKMGESSTLNNLGLLYADLGDRKQGLMYSEQALLISRQLEDKKGEATTLNNIGLIYSDLGNREQGLAYFEQALLLTHRMADKGGEATTITNIGRVYSDLGDKQLALTYYEQALSRYCQVGDRRGEALAHNNIGHVYSALSDKRQALVHYEQALSLYRQVGDEWGEAIALSNTGGTYFDLSDKRQALVHYEQALSLHRQVGDKEGEATALNNIGHGYSRLGDKQQALVYYEQALSIFRQLKNKRSEATILNNIGRIYSDLDDKPQAFICYEQSLLLHYQVFDKKGEAITLNNIGLAYHDLGDRQSALGYYKQSLSLRRQAGDKAGEATTLNNIGGVYEDLDDKQEALGYYERALPLYCQVGNKVLEVATLNKIGKIYADLGEKQQALGCFDQALSRSRQIGDKTYEARLLHNTGKVYADLGEKQQALRYYEQALPLWHQVGDHRRESVTSYNIALAYRSLGDLTAAERWLERTVELDEAIGHPDLASDRAMLEQVRQERRAG